MPVENVNSIKWMKLRFPSLWLPLPGILLLTSWNVLWFIGPLSYRLNASWLRSEPQLQKPQGQLLFELSRTFTTIFCSVMWRHHLNAENLPRSQAGAHSIPSTTMAVRAHACKAGALSLTCTMSSAPPAPFFFSLLIFQGQSPGAGIPLYTSLPCSWDHRYVFVELGEGFTIFLPWLASNHHPPDLHLLSGWIVGWTTVSSLVFAPLDSQSC
jgi:hypothetical protein